MSTALLWLRNDLRVGDNGALAAACRAADRVIPVFIRDIDSEAPWRRGAASRWWLHHSLTALDSELRDHGSRLIVRSGDTISVLLELARRHDVGRVYINRRYEPHLAAADARAAVRLRDAGIDLLQYGGALLCEPESLLKENGEPYRVFTPFWKAFRRLPAQDRPLAAPSNVPPVPPALKSDPVDALNLLPTSGWDEGLHAHWNVGEASARKRLERFLDVGLGDYDRARELLGEEGTSLLSPHLANGEITPREIYCRVQEAMAAEDDNAAAVSFLRQLVWREFAYHILHHYPETAEQSMDTRFRHFPWREHHEADHAAWCRGETGIPLVDAGMRELWRTGTMHNRARMVVASFLTKNLLIPWQHGARWFWDTLVDADLANNSMGWQWVAGSGVDAAPYFRIFNPVRQGERFDPEAAYVRHWIPELRALDNRWVHQPWNAPVSILGAAGLRLEIDYPRPITDLQSSRKRALAAYDRMKRKARTEP